ncbi:MAG TPA: hypothetical protein VHU15_08545 [Stellaceae bacterium]|jgi:hypothetical protein|nr:hypothetical protein [Stellaceae bacterium]
MRNRLIGLAVVGAMTIASSAAALAQICPAGYVLQAGACYPAPATPGGVVAGAANAAGAIVGGAVNTAGAIAGGAVNTAGAIVGGTVGAVAPPPACPVGMVLYADRCYPAR